MPMIGWSSLSMKLSSMGTVRQVLSEWAAGKSRARPRPKLAMKASAWARGTVSERRPTRRSRVELRSRISFSVRPSGRKTSTELRWRQSLKLAGNTPTISYGSPSTRTLRPTIWASPPKRFCQ